MNRRVRRHSALALLVAGVAAIVWAVWLADDRSGDSTTAPASSEPSGSVAAGGSETEVSARSAQREASADAPPKPIEILGEADTLTGLDGWLNTDATSLEEIRAANEVTVVQFWTFGCRNCKKTIPALVRLYEDFGDRGLEIVGVHAPEFKHEAEVDRIIEAAAELKVTWPIALDTKKRNFHRWQEGPTAYWPRVYAIDSDNQIRFDRRGDGEATYRELYETVKRLLAQT